MDCEDVEDSEGLARLEVLVRKELLADGDVVEEVTDSDEELVAPELLVDTVEELASDDDVLLGGR